MWRLFLNISNLPRWMLSSWKVRYFQPCVPGSQPPLCRKNIQDKPGYSVPVVGNASPEGRIPQNMQGEGKGHLGIGPPTQLLPPALSHGKMETVTHLLSLGIDVSFCFTTGSPEVAAS